MRGHTNHRTKFSHSSIFRCHVHYKREEKISWLLIAWRQSNRQNAHKNHTSHFLSPSSKRRAIFSSPRARSNHTVHFSLPAAAHHSSLVKNLAPIKNPIIISGATRGLVFSAPPCFPQLQRAHRTLFRSHYEALPGPTEFNRAEEHRGKFAPSKEDAGARLLPDFN